MAVRGMNAPGCGWCSPLVSRQLLIISVVVGEIVTSLSAAAAAAANISSLPAVTRLLPGRVSS